jgi:hypothetical protein
MLTIYNIRQKELLAQPFYIAVLETGFYSRGCGIIDFSFING